MLETLSSKTYSFHLCVHAKTLCHTLNVLLGAAEELHIQLFVCKHAKKITYM